MMITRGAILGFAALIAVPAVACSQDTTQTPRPGVRIGLNYGPGARPGVVVLPIEQTGGDSIGTIIRRDLDYSDRMDVIQLDSAMRTSIVSPITRRLNYSLAEKFGASIVITGHVTLAGVQIAAYEVASKKKLGAADFTLPNGRDADWRFAVHGVSDEIERWILGIRGIAQSRIAFVQEGAIKVVDSDGAETRTLRGGNGSLSPAWDYEGKRIVYSVLGDVGTQIFEAEIPNGVPKRISSVQPGLNITPVFTPDGKAIVYSHGESEGSDLLVSDRSGATHRLTVSNGTDNNSPSFSPDGGQIAFVSARTGTPQVYIMDADGTNMQLLAGYDMATGGYRSSPDWSPDGQTIAYQQRQGDFQVWMITVRDHVPKQLTTEGENEDPSWAPDARHMVLTSNRGRDKQLWVLDTETGRFRQLTHSSGARLAAWSPILGRHPPAMGK